MAKLEIYTVKDEPGVKNYWFWCPGCRCYHYFSVPRWTFNGDLDRPTFTPSLLCNPDHAPSRCHLFMTDGRIRFLGDCYHELAGQVVDVGDLPDVDL